MTVTTREGQRLPSPLPLEYLVDAEPAEQPVRRNLAVPPIKVAGLRLQLIDTDEGVEFHVIGRGSPFSTFSVRQAEAELEARLTAGEIDWLDEHPYHQARSIVPVDQWDRVNGWTGDGPEWPEIRPKPRLVVERCCWVCGAGDTFLVAGRWACEDHLDAWRDAA